MKRVYVAGAYSADNVIGLLDNMRKGMRASTEVLLSGMAPFSPWLDHHFQFMLKEGELLSVEDYYNYSLTWLEVSEAMLVLPDSTESKGTQIEIKRAQALHIPIFYTLEELKEWKESK